MHICVWIWESRWYCETCLYIYIWDALCRGCPWGGYVGRLKCKQANICCILTGSISVYICVDYDWCELIVFYMVKWELDTNGEAEPHLEKSSSFMIFDHMVRRSPICKSQRVKSEKSLVVYVIMCIYMIFLYKTTSVWYGFERLKWVIDVIFDMYDINQVYVVFLDLV